MGAPEVLTSSFECEEDYSSILNLVNSYAEQGERVLMLACVKNNYKQSFSDNPTICSKAKPIALVRCSERVRADAYKTLEWFRNQGVRCRVISGDNPTTVASVARKVGLTGDAKPIAMDARKLPDDIHELAKVIENVDVLGRVLPEQKKAIVEALHINGHVVAMTGDGVNDTLALKEADLGIAMGNAAPAAKAVAQVVLVDSQFSHLPDVVARGRQVMANMERVAGLFLVKTVYSALISAGVVLLGLHFPYLPRHITYIGSLTIGIPAFLLALAPNTRRYLPGFLNRVVRFALPSGFAIAVSVLLTAFIGSIQGITTIRSICAVIVFVIGILVLSRVSRPLFSWRAIMVLLFALIGVLGAFIPFVSKFFEIHIPTYGFELIFMISAVICAVILWFVCVTISFNIRKVLNNIVKR